MRRLPLQEEKNIHSYVIIDWSIRNYLIEAYKGIV